MSHEVREASAADADDVVRLLDAAMLEFDRERARRRVRAGDALVAVVEGFGGDTEDQSPPDDRIVGASILASGEDAEQPLWPADECKPDEPPTEIEQIAVHQSRRGRGIGKSLVASAAKRADGPLVARFREQVRPFYAALGFEIRECDTRLCGILR
ncbi:GNAT family N-acetyltransferase [Halobellus ordinarius]|uniref:GNAT family N-acetyltransferase n=1 Tax=Halobellus ordinarius TaxID=3075120 RepID=UPI00288019F2|nr:GNAT family N-acetyltransferase [Halobellus sp. ZY16]